MEPLTPEQEDILRHHPASPAADEIRATGAKPDDTAAGKRAEMFRRRCDALIVELHGVLTKLGVDPAAGPESRAEAISKICEESNALRLIAELLGLSRLDPDVIRRRVKDIRTERDAAQARVKELEAACAQATAQISAQAGELGKLYAERDALKERAAKAEDALLKLRAAKCLDAMDDGAERAELEESIRAGLANLSSAGIVVEHAADPAREELAQIWELWGAGRPMTPGCVLDAAQEMERTSTALRVKLGAIAEKMDDEASPPTTAKTSAAAPSPCLIALGCCSPSPIGSRVRRWPGEPTRPKLRPSSSPHTKSWPTSDPPASLVASFSPWPTASAPSPVFFAPSSG